MGTVDYGNERIMATSITIFELNLSCIQVYAPHQGRPVEERGKFYQDLQAIKNLVLYKKIAVLRDMSRHVEQDLRRVKHVIGAYSVNEKNIVVERV